MNAGWIADVSRARADLETALGMVMAVRRGPLGGDDPTPEEREYVGQAMRLAHSASTALDRVLGAWKATS